ncbi:MAG: DUF3516 domain-containing protein, partial [Actinomycetota bacterium]|nr:DUF3516 domain-containing protein [Actinomycetota bacterium]
NALFQRVRLAARDRAAELGELEAANAALTQPPSRPTMTAESWRDALAAYRSEHATLGDGPDARSPQLLIVDRDAQPGVWRARQIIDDPEGHHDWAIVATVDLDASDAAGEPVVCVDSFSADSLSG